MNMKRWITYTLYLYLYSVNNYVFISKYQGKVRTSVFCENDQRLGHWEVIFWVQVDWPLIVKTLRFGICAEDRNLEFISYSNNKFYC